MTGLVPVITSGRDRQPIDIMIEHPPDPRVVLLDDLGHIGHRHRLDHRKQEPPTGKTGPAPLRKAQCLAFLRTMRFADPANHETTGCASYPHKIAMSPFYDPSSEGRLIGSNVRETWFIVKANRRLY